MPPRKPELIGALTPLVIVGGLALLDWGTGGPTTPGGVLAGMLLLGLLAALMAVAHRAATHVWQTLNAALRSVVDMAIGVVLVFALAGPLTALLPQAWVVTLMRDDRATDLVVLLLLGIALLVASRALLRASQEAARVAETARDAALVRAELAERERALAEAELHVLRAQVEPHFLWNTLANVEYLIRSDAPRALAMMGQLITYLRSSLAHGRGGLITLGSEMASVQAYLGLMQVRMGERLTFTLTLDPACADIPFAPLLIQTLVENAIKHGLEPLSGPARLSVEVLPDPTQADMMLIRVTDNGVGLQTHPATRGTGLGLRNLRDQLLARYGERATLSVRGLSTGGVCAQLQWPISRPVA